MISFFACTDKIIRLYFSAAIYIRGDEYFRQGCVKRCIVSEQNDYFIVTGLVKRTQPYKVTCDIQKNGQILNTHCTCFVGSHCKHAVALLLEAISKQVIKDLMEESGYKLSSSHSMASTELNHSINNGLYQVNQALSKSINPYVYPYAVKERLLYVLTITPEKIPQITFYLSRILKSGALNENVKKLSLSIFDSNAKYILPSDEEILNFLRLEQRQDTYQYDAVNLTTNRAPDLLYRLLKTERFYFKNLANPCLRLGSNREAKLTWLVNQAGEQALTCQLEEGDYCQSLNFDPLWYIDSAKQEIGPLLLNFSPAVAIPLLKSPAITPHLVPEVRKELEKVMQKHPNLPLPIIFNKSPLNKTQPQVHIEFLMQKHKETSFNASEGEIPCLALNFQYADLPALPFNRQANSAVFHENTLFTIERDQNFENETLQTIQTLNFQSLHKIFKTIPSHLFVFLNTPDLSLEEQWSYFITHDLALMRQKGWKIIFHKDFPFNIIKIEDKEWYSELFEKADNQWFDLELGITLEGQKINLLPPLLKAIGDLPLYFTKQSINELPDTETLCITLDDGRRLMLPFLRIKPILEVLTELFDKGTTLDEGKLKLSILRSAQIADLMKAANDAAHFRWLGGERLRKLGEKLRQFKGIEPVSPPVGLQTELRPYQREGLNWLQFLREYELAGILADDMGLGKTVQTLAHILLEKESGRMTVPSLVIAPTSLMFNWRMEAERFTPQLRVLTLHGTLRKESFERIQDYDLILTTYPLIVRDEAFLTKQAFYLLILDEAQIIKNPKAKATQIVQLLQAKHRLCLSGTPMENHLGELWSLFHFLLPSLLGEQKQFQRLFRTPIEKQQDGERRAILAKRVAPFLLRRRKSEVVKELPGKVEMLRTIEIESAQRDLYESVRLAMHDKVSQAIRKKGLNRSHIIILDALLKLRQICCDPRLLKIDSAKKTNAQSAKLDFLLDLLPTLIEEGRQILLFSQFTEMLALIESAIKEKNIPYVKLTGQTQDRQTPIEQFQKGEVKLFLISLKAGGVGLNLTAADTVIHYDPWWNPAVEQQATDRAHRIGQTKTVFVYKLIAQGTVEEKIIAMQDKKRALLDGLFDEKNTEKNKLSAEDLADLFN